MLYIDEEIYFAVVSDLFAKVYEILRPEVTLS